MFCGTFLGGRRICLTEHQTSSETWWGLSDVLGLLCFPFDQRPAVCREQEGKNQGSGENLTLCVTNLKLRA